MLALKRSHDWASRLAAYIRMREGMAFDWGRQDCCAFAAGGVQAMTGVDPMAEFRGYRTATAAGRLLREVPLPDLIDAKFLRIDFSAAQRGDLVLVRLDGRLSLTLLEGAFLVGPGEEGLKRLPRALVHAAAQGAWRV